MIAYFCLNISTQDKEYELTTRCISLYTTLNSISRIFDISYGPRQVIRSD